MYGVIGHENIIRYLEKAIGSGSLAQSIMFTGLEGVGKKELAVGLARRLLCKAPDAPCGVCNTCRKIYDASDKKESSRFKHPDVLFVTLQEESDDTGASKTSKSEIVIDQIRDIQAKVATAPFEGDVRVFIIDHADHMTVGASNALLKLLEEPPSYVYIILLAENTKNILETIISRCQVIDLLPVPLETIRKYLMEKEGCDEDRASLIAHLSNGAPVKAERYLNDETLWEERASYIQSVIESFALSRAGRFDYAAKYSGSGADKRLKVIGMLETWLACWRDVLLINVGLVNNVINQDYSEELQKISAKLDAEDIRKYLFGIEDAIKKIRGNANIQLVMEVLMLEMPGLP